MKLLTTVFFCFLFIIVSAQKITLQEEVDKLKAQIEVEGNNIKKLQLLNELTGVVRDEKSFGFDSIARITIDYAIKLDSFNMAAHRASQLIYFHNNIIGQPEEGIEVFNKYFNTLKGKITNRRLASLYIDSGDSFTFTGQIETALAQYDKALEYGQKAGNELVMAFAHLYKGYIYSDEGDFTKASQSFQEASTVFNKAKDTFNIIASKNALAILYSANGFIDEAQIERKEAISLAESIKSYGQLTSLYVNQAYDNKKQGFEEKRITHLLKAEQANKKSKYFDNLNPVLLTEIIKAYAENDSLEKARVYLQELEKNPKDTEGVFEPHYYGALKKIAYADQDYLKALNLGTKHLDMLTELNKVLEINIARLFLVEVYDKLNRPEMAFEHYKVYNRIKDSIQSVQKANSFA